MVSARPQFEAACQLQEFAGLAQWQCRELVPLRRVFDSLDQLHLYEGSAVNRFALATVRARQRSLSLTRFSMAGLAEWLRHRIVAPVTRVRFSHLAPFIRGLRRQAAPPSPTARAVSALALAHPVGRFV